jgi:protein-L-isoaspartate(D-aspartate) O-methyltransferase
VTDWTVLAAALTDELTAAGKLRSPEWQAALRAVPRHELVPVHYTMDPHTGAWAAAYTADDLPQVYSNTALFVLPGGLSSTSMPGLMTRMLETLDIHDGHRVLEIGAGTGYNAALLSHRLGDEQVFAVDIETELVELARERLARLGYHPTLVAADGAHGLPEHAPYDRIIVTCSVPTVPWPWVQQTREGGLILVDIKIGQQAGNLVLLQRRGDIAEGRFDPTYGSFMGIRRAGDTCRLPRSPTVPQHRGATHQRTTTLDLTRPWEQTAFWFFAHTALPLGTSFSLRGEGPHQPPRNTVLHATPTAPGAKSARTARATAPALSGKPARTGCGRSSRTPTPSGINSADPGGNASASPSLPAGNPSGSTPPTASTPGLDPTRTSACCLQKVARRRDRLGLRDGARRGWAPPPWLAGWRHRPSAGHAPPSVTSIASSLSGPSSSLRWSGT